MSLSEFMSIYKKVGGSDVIRSVFRKRIVLSTALSVAANGLSRKGLEIVRLTMEHRLTQRIEREFRPVVDRLAPTVEELYKNSPVKQNDTVWMLWLQGEESAPEIVKTCIASVRQWLPEKKVVVLTEDTYEDYVEFPVRVNQLIKTGAITKTHFSDLLRLELLTLYGGTWIDATVLLTGHPYDFVTESDLFMYQILKPGLDGHSIGVSSWLITAQAPSMILLTARELLLDYWQTHDKLVDYYLIHHFFRMSIVRYPDEWKRVPPASNAIPHVLQLKSFDDNNEPALDALLEQTSVHKLTYKASAVLIDGSEQLNETLKNDIAGDR